MKVFLTKCAIFLALFLIIIACYFVLFFDVFFATKPAFADSQKLVKYNGEIYHLFTHCLIAEPEIAFAKTNPMSKHYDNDCLTTYEFKNILKELYKNDYILIRPSSIFDDSQAFGIKKDLYLPQGKKPLILSFDDVNYDQKKSGKGMVDKITFDKDGRPITYTNGSPEPSYDSEFVSILEGFIATRPDFSYKGARGLICLTGYDGILGYRTNHNSPNYQQEITAVKPVIKKLKELGWEFASHSYGHYHMKKISPEKFRQDVDSWKNEVQSLVGKTSIYVYPYGEREICDRQGNISEKHKYLEDNGFRLFCGVGIKNYFTYLPNPQNRKILFMDRTPLDGYTLKNNYSLLSHLFDIRQVYDNSRNIKLRDFYIE